MGLFTFRRVGKVKKEISGLRQDLADERNRQAAAEFEAADDDHYIDPATPEEHARDREFSDRRVDVATALAAAGFPAVRLKNGRVNLPTPEAQEIWRDARHLIVKQGLTINDAVSRLAAAREVSL